MPYEYDGEHAYIVLSYDDYPVVVKLSLSNSLIKADVYSVSHDSTLIESAIRDTEFIMGLKEDLTEFYELCRGDPLLDPLSKNLYGIHMRGVQNLWQGVLISISQQNASFKQGWRMLSLIRKNLGEEVRIPKCDAVFYTYPTPRTIIERSKSLRRCGVGYREKTFLNAAKAFIREEEPDLLEIKGIGQYSARLAKVLGKRDYREFPVDRWFATLIPRVYAGEEKWSIKKVEEFAKKKWGQWAGLVAIMITIITAAKPIGNLLNMLGKGKQLDSFPNEAAPLTLWKHGLGV